MTAVLAYGLLLAYSSALASSMPVDDSSPNADAMQFSQYYENSNQDQVLTIQQYDSATSGQISSSSGTWRDPYYDWLSPGGVSTVRYYSWYYPSRYYYNWYPTYTYPTYPTYYYDWYYPTNYVYPPTWYYNNYYDPWWSTNVYGSTGYTYYWWGW
jgi:hypothetical protein